MAETRVTMPQLGESVHEGTISKWLVKPGDKVVEFEPMLEVDTDKVSAEVPAPVTGVLKEIIAKEGETVQAGAEIAVVEVDGDGAAPAKAEEAKPEEAKAEEAKPEEAKAEEAKADEAKPEEAKADEAKPEDAKAEEAKPVEAPAGAGDAMPSEEQAERADAEPQPAAPATEEPPSPPRPQEQEGGEHRYSPGVILLAEEEKVDLSQVKGTGLGGRVTKKDMRQFVESRGARPAEAQPATAAATPAGPAAQPAAQPGAGDETVPLTRIRKLIAENMVRSKTTIPHAWQTQEVDMSGVVANRAANKGKFQQQEGFSLTYLPYVIGAAIASLREHPEVNATFNETEIIIHRDINLGVSVGFEDTLLVPVIKRADGLSMAGLARAVNDLATRARAKQLKADDLQGGTFTVNNSGTFGTLFSYSVINPGQAGILTMEAIVERPMAVQGMVGIKPMMYLCFSFDHRVLDGLSAARYLTSCRKGLEAIVAETPIY